MVTLVSEKCGTKNIRKENKKSLVSFWQKNNAKEKLELQPFEQLKLAKSVVWEKFKSEPRIKIFSEIFPQINT